MFRRIGQALLPSGLHDMAMHMVLVGVLGHWRLMVGYGTFSLLGMIEIMTVALNLFPDCHRNWNVIRMQAQTHSDK